MPKIYILPAILLVGILIASAPQPATSQTPGIKLASSGEFTDKDGSIHAWRVNGAHTLIWDGQPYIPVGGTFYSRYACLGQTEENWNADIQTLELIRGKGITDILLKSIGPMTWTKPEAWQRLVDYLDSSGFTYGIDFADGPKPPLTGFIIEPTRYRLPEIINDADFTFDMPDVILAFWILCSAADGSVVASGGAAVSEGKVRVKAKTRPGQNCVLLLYPCKELSNGGANGVADLWSGFDEFRDRLLGFISGLKFGKGLRFFVDPITSKMDFAGERASIVPDSAAFRLEFEGYLAKKYRNIGSLNSAWGLSSENLKSFQEAARLIPLWRGARGIPEVYDRARGARYRIDAPRSKIWQDIEGFRNWSAQNYLNTSADILKRYAADVPVIYKATSYHSVFANLVSRGGFDGLGIEAYGHGEDLVKQSAGSAYSLAEESARSMWFVVTGTQDTQKRGKSSPGYSGSNGMVADLDSLREIGAKGIFVHGLQVLPEDTWKNHSLALAPEQLDWLKSFKDRFATADREMYIPKVVYYPSEPALGATVRRLGPGAWWLPSLRRGARLVLGDWLEGYTFSAAEGICFRSKVGPTSVTFVFNEEPRPTLAHPAGMEGILSVDKKKVVLKLDDDPVLVTGLATDPLLAFPVEVAEEEIARLVPLVARAKAAGLRVTVEEEAVNQARRVLKNGLAWRAYEIAHASAIKVREALGTYVWIEAENAVSDSFDGVKASPAASYGGYLAVDSSSPAPMDAYGAAFQFVATKEATYELWAALKTEDAEPAPFSYSIDNGVWQRSAISEPVNPYGSSFAWYKIGSVALQPGGHLLRLRVDTPNSAGIYKLAVDAIVLSPDVFTPDGIRKP